MTPFEAAHLKIHPIYVPGFGNQLGTFREYAGQVINTGWFYSWYWGEKENPWYVDALKDCNKRIQDTKELLTRLEGVRENLVSIEWHK